MKKFVLFIIIIVVFIALSLGFIFIRYTNEQEGVYENPENINDQNLTVSFLVESQLNLIPMQKFEDKALGFEYSFPKHWRFANGREGKGLISLNLYQKESKYGLENEALTIFAVRSSKSAKEWAQEYDGYGYKVEKELVINGYKSFYVVNETSSFTDIKYTLSNNGIIVHTNFRKLEVDSKSKIYDYTEFEKDVEDIVHSVKFLN